MGLNNLDSRLHVIVPLVLTLCCIIFIMNFPKWDIFGVQIIIFLIITLFLIMDFESPDVERDFPGLYASESGRKSDESECKLIYF